MTAPAVSVVGFGNFFIEKDNLLLPTRTHAILAIVRQLHTYNYCAAAELNYFV